MSSRLDEIVNAARRRVEASKHGIDRRQLERRAAQRQSRGFRRALEQQADRGIALIAELKKASPSKGLIRPNFEARSLAQELEAAGAAALSVLTDEEYFQGSLENLQVASAVTKLPCLRKDFIVDEFQILEARANAADAILLIVAALNPRELKTLTTQAADMGLDVLCEAHDEEELRIALDAGCNLVGINARNLKTFEVNVETVFRLAQLLPETVVRVAESGIHSATDLIRLREAGYDAFLVGESLMRAESPGKALRELLDATTKTYSPQADS